MCNLWYFFDLVYIFKDILCTKKLVSWNCAIVVVQYWCEIHLINCIFRFNTLWIQCIYMMEHYTMIKKQNRLKFSIESSSIACLKFISAITWSPYRYCFLIMTFVFCEYYFLVTYNEMKHWLKIVFLNCLMTKLFLETIKINYWSIMGK